MMGCYVEFEYMLYRALRECVIVDTLLSDWMADCVEDNNMLQEDRGALSSSGPVVQ